jgi:DNA-binding NarL/FixJ family response regulator
MKIKQYRQCREYYYVVLARPTKTIFVHRVVAQSFLGVHKGMIVNHKDGNKLNNKLENLEWVTYRENTLHAKMTGLINNSGERHYKAMLTNNDVLEIRGLLRSGLPQRKIAKKYNVTQTTISCINRNKTWKHI